MDIAGLFSDVKIASRSGDQVSGYCPFHTDKNPSFSYHLTDGLWKCFKGCGEGDAADYAKLKGLDPKPFYRRASVVSKTKKNGHIKANTTAELDTGHKRQALKYHKHLIQNYDSLISNWPVEKMIIEKLFIGYDKENKVYTFPHFNHAGKLINIKYHKGLNGEAPHSIPGHGGNRLYPMNRIKDYSMKIPLVWCEGEKDCITLISKGYQALTNTTGAGSVPRDLSNIKGANLIYIVLDNDEPGRMGSQKIAKAINEISPMTEIRIIEWESKYPEKYDVTDYFIEHNREQFDELLVSSLPLHDESVPVIPVRSFTDLVNDPTPAPVQILDKGLLVSQSILMIAGAPKTGKSLLSLNLGCQIATGQDWFEFKTGDKHKVLVIQSEVVAWALKDRLNQMRMYLDPGNFLLITEPCNPDILTNEGYKSILQAVQRHKPDVLIFDPLVSFHGKEENSNNEMQQVMNKFRELTFLGLSVIIIHHSRKFTEGSSIASARGASSITGSVDSMVELVRKKDGRMKAIFNLRYDRAPSEFELELNPETLFFEKWDSDMKQKTVPEVINYVKDHAPEPVLISDIGKHLSNVLGIHEKSVYPIVNNLIDSGILKDTGKVRNNRVFLLP